MKKRLNEVCDYFEKISFYITKTLIQHKGNLFKGAIAVISFSLIALSQTMPFLYDKELVSYEKKFKFEALVKKPIEKVNCDKPGNLQLDCKIIQHELKLLSDSSGLLDSIIRLSKQISVLLLIFAGIGFLFEMDEEANVKNKRQVNWVRLKKIKR